MRHLDLDIAWIGDSWFFDNGDLGLTAAELHGGTASVTSSNILGGACFSICWPQRDLTTF